MIDLSPTSSRASCADAREQSLCRGIATTSVDGRTRARQRLSIVRNSFELTDFENFHVDTHKKTAEARGKKQNRASIRRHGARFGRFRAASGPSWVELGPFSAGFGQTPHVGRSGASIGRSWTDFGPVSAAFRPSSAKLGRVDQIRPDAGTSTESVGPESAHTLWPTFSREWAEFDQFRTIPADVGAVRGRGRVRRKHRAQGRRTRSWAQAVVAAPAMVLRGHFRSARPHGGGTGLRSGSTGSSGCQLGLLGHSLRRTPCGRRWPWGRGGADQRMR